MKAALRRALAEAAESVRMSFGTLAANRLRSSLTTLGIVIGVMTVIAIVAIVQGLNQSVAAQVSAFGAHTVYVSKWPFVMLTDERWKLRNRKNISRVELEAIERDSQLATAVAPWTFARGTVGRAGREAENVQLSGTSSQYMLTSGGTLRDGRFIADSDVALARPVVVLGVDVSEQLFPGESAASIVGQTVKLGGRRFDVVGILERRGRLMGMVSLDNLVMIPWTTHQRIFGDKRPMSVAVATQPGHMEALEDELTGILRRARGVAPGKDDDFNLNRQEQLVKVYESLTGALYGVAVGVGVITLIVGGIGIMNIMLVSVHERTREIGVRRALGARRRTILAQFLVESSIVAALGGTIGTALGLGAAQLVAVLTPLAAVITPSAIALGLGFSAAVGLLFGSWPAWRAANLDPVEALRWE